MGDTDGAMCCDTSEESAAEFMFPEEVVAKRKSSIFAKRKSSVFNRSSVAFMDKEAPCGSSSSDTADMRQVDREEYVEILENEISDWKKLYMQRRDDRKKATKQFRTREVFNQDLVGILTEEDKIFLANRPNYSKTEKEAMSALERMQISVEGTRDVGKSISNVVAHVHLAACVMRKGMIEESAIQ